MILAAGVAGIMGAVIGSFLNVVIHRLPQGRSLVSPRSACGACGAPVRWYDNIPLVSWLVLRGKCRDCRSGISIRYPLVELGTAALFAVVALRFVPQVFEGGGIPAVIASILVLVAFLYLAAISVALAAIDLDTHRLPNAIVVPAYGVGVVLLTAAAVLTGAYPALLTALAGALIMGGFYLALALVRPGGMGAGDIKLAGVLGLFLGWLGWMPLAVGLLAGFILGGLFGLVLIIARRATRSTGIPFGPWMLAGAWVGILAGSELASGYLALFGVGES